MARPLLLTAIILTVSLASHVDAQEGDDFRWTPIPTSSVQLQLAGGAPAVVTGAERAFAEAAGQESSTCGAGEERRSGGRGESKASSAPSGGGVLSATLTAAAYANGGHYVQCSSCAFGVCLGRTGVDTTATTTADAALRATLTFGPRASGFYTIRTSGTAASSEKGVRVQIYDDSGVLLYDAAQVVAAVRVAVRPSSSFQVVLSLSATATDTGACCQANSLVSLNAALSAERAPIAETKAEASQPSDDQSRPDPHIQPRIVGGADTEEFDEVGAILLRERVHCTGTLVGPSTVLTAAHCVQRYRATDMRFMIGSSVHEIGKIRQIVPIVSADWPQDPGGFNYRPEERYEDDIAVVYLQRPVNDYQADLFDGAPALTPATTMIFVGFGYDAPLGATTRRLGVKRQVPMPIRDLAARRFTYGDGKQNTCGGDSGGPSYLTRNGRRLVAGVVSFGDQNCVVYGVNTRIDAYLKWLRPRIR